MDPDFEREYPGASRVATECFANLVRTGDMLIGLHNRQALDDHGLSSSAKMALAVIEGAGEPLEPGVIAERLIITAGSMTSMLDTLEKRGLVRRSPHPTDRRKLLIDITEAAEAILDEMLPALHDRERVVMDAALTRREQKALLAMLAKIQVTAGSDAAAQTNREARRQKGRRETR